MVLSSCLYFCQNTLSFLSLPFSIPGVLNQKSLLKNPNIWRKERRKVSLTWKMGFQPIISFLTFSPSVILVTLLLFLSLLSLSLAIFSSFSFIHPILLVPYLRRNVYEIKWIRCSVLCSCYFRTRRLLSSNRHWKNNFLSLPLFSPSQSHLLSPFHKNINIFFSHFSFLFISPFLPVSSPVFTLFIILSYKFSSRRKESDFSSKSLQNDKLGKGKSTNRWKRNHTKWKSTFWDESRSIVDWKIVVVITRKTKKMMEGQNYKYKWENKPDRTGPQT